MPFPALNRVNNEDIWNLHQGAYKQRLVTDTTVLTPAAGDTFYCIVPVADVVFSTLTGANFAVTGSLPGTTFPAGIPIFGDFSAITLASGRALIYSRPILL
jgi:hypothetical protein